jgi:hypothetical protein
MGGIQCHECDQDGLKERAWFCKDHGFKQNKIWYTSKDKKGNLLEPKYEICELCKRYTTLVSRSKVCECCKEYV